MLLENNFKPGNESAIHYELKQIAKYILKNKGCQIIGEEIEMGHSKYLSSFEQFNKNKHYKSRIDAVGLKLKGTFHSHQYYKTKEIEYKEPIFNSIGIESKASLEDFKNGFCTLCEKTIIIAPKGAIPLELIPDKIGLIEVDIDSYTIKEALSGMSKRYLFEGIEEVIRPKINLDPRFKLRDKPVDNKEYQYFCKDLLRFIAYRYTVDNLYKKNEIEINK